MSTDHSGTEFEEREERLKVRFLELEDVTDSDEWERHVIGEEDDDERHARERRERDKRLKDEERAVELAAIQEIYKRASKRAFRRLKNLPEPVPGCFFTGTGEEEEEQRAYFPGEVEESAEAYMPPASAVVQREAAADVDTGSSPTFCHSFLKRSHRRRRRRSVAALMRSAQQSHIAASCGVRAGHESSHYDAIGTAFSDAAVQQTRTYHTDTIPPPSPVLPPDPVPATPHPPRGSADAIAALVVGGEAV